MKESDDVLANSQIPEFLKESQVEAVFIQKDENCRYISGFTGSDSYLFFNGQTGILLTDSRYTEQAAEEAKGFQIIDYKGKLAETVGNLCRQYHVSRLGVEAPFSYKMFLSFQAAFSGVDIQVVDADRLRRIKSTEELENIKKACEISDKGFEETIPFIKPGITEKQLMAVLESAMLQAGSEGKSFDTIVASGERGAYPHGTATDKVIEDGDLITFDFGAIYNGYHSDITRTVAVGNISDKQRFIYDRVLDCVLLIEGQLKAGCRACDVDKQARDYFRKFDLDSYFTHALGHSVGLEIHESPVLAPRDSSILLPGMTETIEPGVYIPGIGGVRIEDTVIINEDTISVLTKFPKQFLRV